MGTLFMMQHFLFAVVIFSVAAAITGVMVRYLRVMDVPNERSSHHIPTPRGGGISMSIAFLTGISLIHLLGDKSPIYSIYFGGFMAAVIIISTISFYDDIRHCHFRIKLGSQLLAIFVAMLSGIVIDVMHLPLLGEVALGGWAYPLTLLWVFGLTNAYNFIDGLDGLAAGTAVIAAGFLSYISFQQGSHFIYLASLTLAAAALGLLIFNLPTARIFMGDVGSTFLGLAFAVMAVIAARYDHSHTSLFVVPLLLFHFIFDTIFTFLRRLLAGEHVFTAHRTHLYQLINRMGLTHGQVTAIYSLLAVVQGVAAVGMMQVRGDMRVVMFLPFLAVYAVAAWWVVARARRLQLIQPT